MLAAAANGGRIPPTQGERIKDSKKVKDVSSFAFDELRPESQK